MPGKSAGGTRSLRDCTPVPASEGCGSLGRTSGSDAEAGPGPVSRAATRTPAAARATAEIPRRSLLWVIRHRRSSMVPRCAGPCSQSRVTRNRERAFCSGPTASDSHHTESTSQGLPRHPEAAPMSARRRSPRRRSGRENQELHRLHRQSRRFMPGRLAHCAQRVGDLGIRQRGMVTALTRPAGTRSLDRTVAGVQLDPPGRNTVVEDRRHALADPAGRLRLASPDRFQDRKHIRRLDLVDEPVAQDRQRI